MPSRRRTIQYSSVAREQDARRLALAKASIATSRKLLADNPSPDAFAGRKSVVPIAKAPDDDRENMAASDATSMNRKLEQQHLTRADAHLVVAKRVISEQTARVEKLRHDRHDTRLAEETLRIFELSLQTLHEHRASIVKAIEEMDHALQASR